MHCEATTARWCVWRCARWERRQWWHGRRGGNWNERKGGWRWTVAGGSEGQALGIKPKRRGKEKRKWQRRTVMREELRVPRCTWSVRRPVSEPSAIIPPYTGKYGIHPFKRSSVSFHLASLFLTNSYAHVTVPNMYLIIFWHYYRNCNPGILLGCTAWANERKKMDRSLGGRKSKSR